MAFMIRCDSLNLCPGWTCATRAEGEELQVKLPKEQQTRCGFTVRTFNGQGELVTLSQKETARRFQEMLEKRDAPRRVTPPSERSNQR